MCSDSFLDISVINPELHHGNFQYPSSKGPILQFNDIAEWRDYLVSYRIRSRHVPAVFAGQFHIALRIMLFAWVDGRVLKAAELTALSALEGSLCEVYCRRIHAETGKKRPTLANYLDYMVEHDGLGAAYRSGKRDEKPNALNNIRNGIAHGSPFSNLPWGGLLEAVRDIIEHAFRGYPECSDSIELSGVAELDEDFSEMNVW